jgi:hypothetical protein
MEKRLYAYLIQYNRRSDNPSYDVRYYEKEVPIEQCGPDYQMFRAENLDTYLRIPRCKTCGKPQ